MFFRRITLFRLFGFPIQIDLSWIFLVLLLGWSLSTGLFPRWYEHLPADTYTWMGFLGTAGFVLSILFHELAHALVAQRYGLSIRSITLFIFGGVAELEDEPPHARAEFWVTAAGPAASFLLAAAAYGGYRWVVQHQAPEHYEGLLFFLAWLNGMLAIFNLIPAFPLDGGRILRAVLWGWRGDLHSATRIAAGIGAAFGTLLIVLALVQAFLYARFLMALWWLIIGLFMRNASQASYMRLRLREMLRGESIRRFLTASEEQQLPSSLSIRRFVEDYVEREPHHLYPVMDSLSGRWLGCVHLRDLTKLPPDEWENNTLRAITSPCEDAFTIHIESDALQALSQMSRKQINRLVVIDDERQYLGMIAMADVAHFLQAKLGTDVIP
jgi:Zn-dependent protease/CBS domain-containing protein